MQLVEGMEPWSIWEAGDADLGSIPTLQDYAELIDSLPLNSG